VAHAVTGARKGSVALSAKTPSFGAVVSSAEVRAMAPCKMWSRRSRSRSRSLSWARYTASSARISTTASLVEDSRVSARLAESVAVEHLARYRRART